MLRRPVTISIAPSRLGLACSTLLALAVCALVACYGPAWLAFASSVTMVVGLCREWRQARALTLRWVPGQGNGWQRKTERGWQPVVVSCAYLGPFLAGLDVAGRRHWLWVDSVESGQRWHLRRLLLWSE
ncbi:hypothetical protein [Modicisalibacter radicis]|uniref:hypothetical protein n=1 Tax=Halomonas sp. EAR18 TaxID=2518972 RepID=UPI00109C6FBD|nr:hypothetical protein [Halomonas sp. EAR18]